MASFSEKIEVLSDMYDEIEQIGKALFKLGNITRNINKLISEAEKSVPDKKEIQAASNFLSESMKEFEKLLYQSQGDIFRLRKLTIDAEFALNKFESTLKKERKIEQSKILSSDEKLSKAQQQVSQLIDDVEQVAEVQSEKTLPEVENRPVHTLNNTPGSKASATALSVRSPCGSSGKSVSFAIDNKEPKNCWHFLRRCFRDCKRRMGNLCCYCCSEKKKRSKD